MASGSTIGLFATGGLLTGGTAGDIAHQNLVEQIPLSEIDYFDSLNSGLMTATMGGPATRLMTSAGVVGSASRWTLLPGMTGYGAYESTGHVLQGYEADNWGQVLYGGIGLVTLGGGLGVAKWGEGINLWPQGGGLPYEVPNKKPFDLDSLRSLEVDGLKAQRIVQGDNGKVAVIGRAMGNDKINGVRDYASVLQKQGYDVELFDGDMIPRSAQKEFERLTEGGRWLTNPDLVKSEMYQANKAWAQKIKSEGYTIIDLGDPHNQGFSPFYAVEKLTVFGGGK